MEFVVADNQEEACPYLPGRRARLPLRLPLRPVRGLALDRLLDEGDRRAGPFFYRTACAGCAACEPLRIPVARFRPTASQRRTLKRNADLRIEVGPPRVDEERLSLFNRHKLERGLGNEASDRDEYRVQFVQSSTDTREIRYLAGDRLLAVSLLDVGAQAASSVYHYFDPDQAKRSLGVFSVLAEIALCAAWQIDWYYLGYYVAGCRSLSYKADYFPHERRIDGTWRVFETR